MSCESLEIDGNLPQPRELISCEINFNKIRGECNEIGWKYLPEFDTAIVFGI